MENMAKVCYIAGSRLEGWKESQLTPRVLRKIQLHVHKFCKTVYTSKNIEFRKVTGLNLKN